MRFVWAVVAFVLATLMIGAGIAQRTVLRGPETVSETVAVSGDAPFTLLDGSVLTSRSGTQTLRIEGDGTIFAAYGRTSDVEAWLARADHATIEPAGDGEVAVTDVAATAAVSDEGAEAAAPVSPVGSDLWLEEFQREDALMTSLQLPADMSVLIASDGTAAAPSDIRITWPVESNTPWAGPLIVGGGIMLAVGIVLYALGWRHLRRSRGPRRKGVPLTATQPIDLAIDDESAERGVIAATPPRRRLTRGRGSFIALPVVVVSALALSGCSADAWPQLSASETPTPTATVVAEPDQQTPAVTQAQAERILTRIAEDVSQADAGADAALAGTRLTGPALAERETNYTLRATITDRAPLPPIPAEPLQILLPETFDQWPRTFLAVVEGSGDSADTIMTVSQQDPWSNYKLGYISELATDTFPELAPAYLGAPQVAPDSPFLLLPPQELAAAYADLLTNGDASPFASLFEADGDAFRAGVASNREQIVADFNQTGAETGTVSFTTQAGTQAPIALQTLESGAIVAVTITEDHTFTPSNPDAVINVPDTNPVASALTGVSQSSTGFTTTYADQLFFFVPAAGSNEPIQFLGYRSNVLSAKVV
ncbi:glycosyl transferase [Microbacterium radiodurans]|uniref:Glycosyl transferase n=1 Tax=Microbacterium radiodurans TaxID=661398 RepID=A0A5J5ISL9_9MICO|nr:glycosyl transferase [Microbacterium radiodurans]KAA9086878.1 glycosyl transferase [Microbacterium radiodurans]